MVLMVFYTKFQLSLKFYFEDYTYNKDSEHEVIYYKGFETEEEMEKAELIVLLRLRKYNEKANRDRFILPVGENIKLFTDVIDEAWKFFN